MKDNKNALVERARKAGRAHAAEQARKVYDRAKDAAENLMDDGQITPEEYASDQIKYTSEEAADYAVHAAGHDAKTAVRKGRESFRRHAEKAKNNAGRGTTPAQTPSAVTADNGAVVRGFVHGRPAADDVSSRTAPNGGRRFSRGDRLLSGRDRLERSGRVRVSNGPGARSFAPDVKTPGGVPGAKAGHAAELSRKAAIQSAQKAQRTEHVVKKQAEKSAKAAKSAAQAAKNAARAVADSVKSAFAALAAGGTTAMMILVIVLIVGLLAGSIFAIFLPDDEERMSTRSVIQSIDQEYNARLEEIKNDYSYDRLELSGNRAPWREVLAVYAVKVNTDPENPRDVAVMDEDRAEELRDVFWDMTEIDAETGTVTEIEYVETVDEDGNPITETVETELTVLYITVSHKPVEEIALEYGFDEERLAQLEELLSDEYASLWNNVLYGTHSGCADLVAVALSQVGNSGETYWTYMGYTGRVEWCACFVSWCANECGYIADGTLPQTASCSAGVSWFQERNRWQEPTYTNAQGQSVPYIPAPGDIIYFDWDRQDEGQNGRPDHVGIVEKVENGYIYTIEGNSGDRVSANTWRVGYYEIFGFGISN
jgi:CHAP domain.